MNRLHTTTALLASALAVTACGPVTGGLSPHLNPSIASVNQPVVQRTDYVLDIASTGSGVPAAELSRLDAWFESLQLGYGDRVSLDEPAGYGDSRSRRDVAAVAGARGLLMSEGAPVTAGSVHPGTVRVIVSRTIASVPGCPHWNNQEIGARITTAPNYGCAVNSNLAAMIADPNDLVLGQSSDGQSDPRTTSKAIQMYRDRKPTGEALKIEETGGKK